MPFIQMVHATPRYEMEGIIHVAFMDTHVVVGIMA